MISSQSQDSTSYRIEISGWDMDENFFVEKTELDWSEANGKRAYVRHPLRDGAVVFVRLIAPTAHGHTVPIAYQVENVKPQSGAGLWEVLLKQLHPHSAAQGNRQHFSREALASRQR